MTTRVDRAIARNMRRSYKYRQCTKERSGEGFEVTVDVTSPAEAQEWATKLTPAPRNTPVGWPSYLDGFQCSDCTKQDLKTLITPNGDRSGHRPSNLRDVTTRVTNQNRHKVRAASGLRGVYEQPDKRTSIASLPGGQGW